MVDHWTFVGELGMGDFTDLVCIGRILYQTSLELEIFSPTYNGVRLFFNIVRPPRNLFACFFPLEISLQDTFFLKSPITPSKVKWSTPKIHQTFGQLTNSDFSFIS